MRKNIPKALREQVWIKTFGEVFKTKCYITWCSNTINVFDFHVGHIIPHSKGGSTHIDNLLPICSRCNLSMSDKYTIDEWNNMENMSTISVKKNKVKVKVKSKEVEEKSEKEEKTCCTIM